MKKIGVLTMHRVCNFGSVLQSFALQRKLHDIGVENKIIDFIFPPYTAKSKASLIKTLFINVIDFLCGSPKRISKNRFKIFIKDNLLLTEKSYNSQTLAECPPIFDAYLTGSDQVWNPTFIKEDTTFLLSFVPNQVPRASYASSFAIDELPNLYKKIYADELNKFARISVRERSGVKIVKDLIHKDSKMVCDPTLLLEKAEWDNIAEKSSLELKKKYILVYALSYMYNPYPHIYHIVENVQKELGNLEVVYLIGQKSDIFRHKSRLIKNAGPYEFVYLFKHAEFVITTSFHGTVFISC